MEAKLLETNQKLQQQLPPLLLKKRTTLLQALPLKKKIRLMLRLVQQKRNRLHKLEQEPRSSVSHSHPHRHQPVVVVNRPVQTAVARPQRVQTAYPQMEMMKGLVRSRQRHQSRAATLILLTLLLVSPALPCKLCWVVVETQTLLASVKSHHIISGLCYQPVHKTAMSLRTTKHVPEKMEAKSINFMVRTPVWTSRAPVWGGCGVADVYQ